MPWDFELLKTVLGFSSIVGGTASGIAALLVEYKDDEGKITKWGRYALFGVGASFLIGASNLWLDYTQKKAESRETANKSREAAEQTLRIVTDLSRSLNPLKDVHVESWVTYSFNQPNLAQYRVRLDDSLRKIFPTMKASGVEIDQDGSLGIEGGSIDADGSIVELSIGSTSPLFPDRVREPHAFSIITDTYVKLEFFKAPVDVTKSVFNWRRPDLHMSFNNDGTQHTAESYEPITSKISAYWSAPADPQHWDSSGKIVSVLDLPGTQMLVRIDHIPRDTAPHDSKAVRPELDILVLKIAERRAWRFRRSKLKLVATDDESSPIYEYIFPNTIEALLQDVEAD